MEEYEPASVDSEGNVRPPTCCSRRMTCVGGCSEGCCDDFVCEVCGLEVKVEWPD